jgi:hypothetical protein
VAPFVGHPDPTIATVSRRACYIAPDYPSPAEVQRHFVTGSMLVLNHAELLMNEQFARQFHHSPEKKKQADPKVNYPNCGFYRCGASVQAKATLLLMMALIPLPEPSGW